jgi:hypothetical protein
MPNIKFSYLYRDGGNYKRFGYVIFRYSVGVNLYELNKLVRSKLVDETWFYADRWKLPDLRFNSWDNEMDHNFHEFESIEHTHEPPNISITSAEFKTLIGN